MCSRGVVLGVCVVDGPLSLSLQFKIRVVSTAASVSVLCITNIQPPASCIQYMSVANHSSTLAEELHLVLLLVTNYILARR